MNLLLLAPLFLVGLAGLVVPVIVHLFHRHQKEAVQFPSLMFLRRIPYKDMRRQQLRHKLLFALRSLALILLALAFARPFLDRSAEASVTQDVGRDVIILLDRSHSMRYGNRWEQAVQRARDRILATGAQELLSLVLFADDAEAVVQSEVDPSTVISALERAGPGSGGTRYSPALQLAGRLLEESDQPQREVVLITDFQRSGWDGLSDVRLPAGTVVVPVDLSNPDAANLSVPFAVVQHETDGRSERISVSSRVVNGGPQPADNVVVTLSLNGQELARRSIDIEPAGSQAVSFPPVLLPSGLSRGVIRAGTDDLPQDNDFVFVVRPQSALSVLILETSAPRENQSLYLQRALSIGDSPHYDVTVRELRRFRLEDLEGRAVVVLNDAPFPGGQAGRALQRFVQEGGGLLVALGERNGPATWPDEASELMPGRVGNRIDPPRGAVTLASLSYSNPVFEIFSGPRSGDFSSARFFRYRELVTEASAEVIARFNEGSVALAARDVGEGVVLVWTSTLDNYWNELPLRPVFLPLMRRLARYLSGYQDVRNSFTVGDAVELSGGGSADLAVQALVTASRDLVVEGPSGERSILRVGEENSVVELVEQGFYELRLLEGADLEPATIPTNLAAAESNLATLDVEEFLGALAPPRSDNATSRSARTLTIDERERRQGLWWYLLAAAVSILAIETVLSNRLSRVAR